VGNEILFGQGKPSLFRYMEASARDFVPIAGDQMADGIG
jgi:hypothetical protein